MEETPKRKFKISFGLGTLLFIVAMICAFLAGRASHQSIKTGDERPIGDWKMIMPAGFQRQCVIYRTVEGDFKLRSGETNFNGIYELIENQLVMKKPENPPAKAMVWDRDGSGWILTTDLTHSGDPDKYIGCRLRPWGYKEQSAEGEQE